jgi:hypothetical protein
VRSLKPVTMYQCQHCKKLFKTPDKHNCRRDLDKTNCYTCEHWGRQFHLYLAENISCDIKDACKIEGDCACEAFETMKSNGWYLNCSDYKGI